MNINSKRLRTYIIAMLIMTAVATALRTVACLTELDFASGFYTDKSFISAANLAITLTVLGMLSYALVAKEVTLHPSFSTGATYVPTGILGVASAFLGVKAFSYVLVINNYRLYNFRASSLKELIAGLTTPVAISTTIGIIAGVLAFISIAHHFFNTYHTEGESTVRAYFAIASIAFLAFYGMLVYLDSSVTVNDPSKNLRQITLLIAASFFLYEARISLGRPMWRAYTALGLVTATLTAYTSIPAIITYYVKGELLSYSSYKSLASIEEYILILALFIFTVSRLSLTATLKQDKPNELVKAFHEVALKRANEVDNTVTEYVKDFATSQPSLFEIYGDSEEEQENVEETTDATPEDEEKVPMISDDAIYESIFGKLPERPTEEAPTVEDNRDTEEIIEDLMQKLERVEEAEKADHI